MKKRIIITGGLGQDAIILNNLLIKKNYSTYLIINKKKPKKKINTTFLNINLLNLKKVNECINNIKPHAIIHLAAKNISLPKRKSMMSEIYYRQNFLMTQNLIDSIIKYNKKIKFIFAGSSQMFMKKKGIVDENSKFKATCYYSKYKIDAHKYIMKKKKLYSLNATTSILFNHDSIHRNKIFLLPRLALYFKQKKISLIKEIYNDDIFGDFSHAEDICNGIFLILKSNKNPDKIIFSFNNLISINKLIEIGLNKFKINNNFKVNNSKIIKLVGNNNFAKKILNWKITKNSELAFQEIIKNVFK